MTWRCFLNLTGNAGFGALAGFGIAGAMGGTGLDPLVYEGIGLVLGGMAGMAACL